MRLLIYGINYAPELTGVGKYTGEMAEWFAAQGFEVRVVTAMPYYPAWTVADQYRGKTFHQEQLNGVTVWRCPLWVTPQPTSLQRLLHLFSFTLSSLPVMLSQTLWRPDCVIVIEPAFSCVPTALLAARLSGACTWLHIQDFEIDAAFELGLLPKRGWLNKVASGIERWMLHRFDRVSSISMQMLNRLWDKTIQRELTVLFPNWVDTEQIFPLLRPSCLKTQLGFADDDLVVLYSGNMSSKQGLDLLLEVAEQFKYKLDLHFVLCGDGTARKRLEAAAANLQLANITFLPLQPAEAMNELLNLADIHALVQRGTVADLVMPSKLTGMMASGRPVIATANAGTAIADVMQEADCGKIVCSDNLLDFVAALDEMLDNAAERQRWGNNGRNYARKQFGKERVLSSMAQHLTGFILNREITAYAPQRPQPTTREHYLKAKPNRKELLSRISTDPNVYFGKPYIREHNIWVSLILDTLASGMTAEELLQQHPGLEETDILACIAYGAEMSRELNVKVSSGSEE